MRSILAIIFMFAVPASSGACDWKPPLAYDYPPTVPYRLQRLTSGALNPLCDAVLVSQGFRPMGNYYGCADMKKRRIYVLAGGTPDCREEHIIRHERAHMNGWLHPEATF